MQRTSELLTTIASKLPFIETLSIKQLTLLGFSLVALPLVVSLLYSANQVSQLSQQSANAIFKVAELTNTRSDLGNALKKMERSVSQYLVLQDEELKKSTLEQYQLIVKANKEILLFDDNKLNQLSIELSHATTLLHQKVLLSVKSMSQGDTTNITNETLSLEGLQQQFFKLIQIQEAIKLRSNNLINQQATQIKDATEQISQTLFKSILIIPLSLFIAAVFILLITRPLKQLTYKIQRFEKGNFQQDNNSNINNQANLGVKEIQEINHALDTMRTRLHALELQKSSFIRHISHDLKTPLAAIREGTELLYDHSVGELNDEQQEITKIIRTSTTKLQRLIEELLDFNIVLDSTSLQDKAQINLLSLIQEVIEERTLEIKRKQIRIEQTVKNTLNITSNNQQLSVIIDNILSNAIKYSPLNGVITITATRDKKDLQLTFTDQGSGIEASQQDKIFDAFYQGTPSLDNNIKSSGLGLTIVKELLMRLDGKIWVTSKTSPPSMTCIKITLPRVFIGEQ